MFILCPQPTLGSLPPFLLTFLLEHQLSSSIHNFQSIKITTLKITKYFSVHVQRLFLVFSHSKLLLSIVMLCRFSKRILLFCPPCLLIQGSYPFALPHCHIMTSPFRPSLTRTPMQSFLGAVQSNLPLLCFLCNLYLYVCCLFQVSCHGKIP